MAMYTRDSIAVGTTLYRLTIPRVAPVPYQVVAVMKDAPTWDLTVSYQGRSYVLRCAADGSIWHGEGVDDTWGQSPTECRLKMTYKVEKALEKTYAFDRFYNELTTRLMDDADVLFGDLPSIGGACAVLHKQIAKHKSQNDADQTLYRHYLSRLFGEGE